MSDESSSLFDVELSEPIAAVVRKVEALSSQPIESTTADDDLAAVAPLVGYFDDDGKPKLACGDGHEPTEADIAVEVLRLELRDRTSEKRMPYADMRNPKNRQLCQSLYRIMENEILLALAQAHGVDSRAAITTRLEKDLIAQLEKNKYRKKERDPARTRLGTLDGLELMVAYVDRDEALRGIEQIAKHDDAIAAQLGLLYKVVQNNRPFDDGHRVRVAYYLAVPFLFDTRKPSRPRLRTR